MRVYYKITIFKTYKKNTALLVTKTSQKRGRSTRTRPSVVPVVFVALTVAPLRGTRLCQNPHDRYRTTYEYGHDHLRPTQDSHLSFSRWTSLSN